MVRGIDLLRLFLRTMVEPQNDISIVAIFVVEIRTSYRDGLVCVLGENGERARSIEADAADGNPVDIVLVDSPADRRTDATPNI